ncbi:MAG TPA: PP2C family protein-serine/threonine phosphatase [Candidatus Limnocylindrales bacterium]|nr:PP2C family protein-serine/threonine phosphatase [Candidatus Limnocylindrales bacterium]
MQKGYSGYWRRIGRLEQSFLIILAVYLLLRFSGISPGTQLLFGLAGFLLGIAAVFRLARRVMKEAIWRLRNRLIVAYLFIAVVPIVLILTLAAIAGWVLIGQMAVYLVNTELRHREASLLRPAEALAHIPPGREPENALRRFAQMIHNNFPSFQLLMSGNNNFRYPETAEIAQPPQGFRTGSGLTIRNDAGHPQLYAFAHVIENGDEVIVLAPVSRELLDNLVTGLGDVAFAPLMARSPAHIPPAQNIFDFTLGGFYPVEVPLWDTPGKPRRLVLHVDTRISAVLGTVFQKLDWAELALGIFVVISIVFLLVELVSLIAGIQLSRTITGAVHELYEGTQHVKEGDFTYRIPVKGNDQLAELSGSFNTMTENLSRLIVVAKEKERLESELAIAREVQNQLFPKDVPMAKTLELKGVCNPARMVSGDYYDFMTLTDSSLAFAIGDVAGKGISAALLMATIQSTMRMQLSLPHTNGLATAYSTAALVSTLNKQLYATTSPEKYATFYFALYEEATRSLTYTNAGHLSPMLFRAGNFQMLDSTGTVVGAFPIARYEERTIPLERGDILVAYTDGIVEPENAYGEMFGEDRLMEYIAKYSSADSSEIIARTMEAVVDWTGSSELYDDMTMVVARRI